MLKLAAVNTVLRTITVALFVFCISCLVSCSNTPEPGKRVGALAKGGVNYGGLFKMNMTDYTRSLFPHDIVDASATNIMNLVYEGLLKIDPDSKEIIPALAESYQVSSNGLVYSFKIREGVYFHDDKAFKDGEGREVKAEDVAFCFKKLCQPSPTNQLYAFVIDLIKDARPYYEGKIAEDSFNSIRATGDYTLEIELEYPAPTFLSILTHPCCWVFPKELYEYGDDVKYWCIGTGPFMPRTIKANEVVIFQRNPRYWRSDKFGNRLPYLDAVRCNYLTDETEQLEQFLEGNLDLILKVPYSSVQQLRAAEQSGGFKILTVPGLRVEYYGFQHRSELFQDLRLRKAINYAIDRRFLVDSILFGFGEPAFNGFVPPVMPNFPSDSVQGFGYNPQLARELMAEAGYLDGKDFPVLALQLNDGNKTILEVAEAVQQMLVDNLNITMELSVLPRDRHYEQIESGKVAFWRDGWIGDYADPENFLKLFHGKLVPDDTVKSSYLNSIRFKNNNFDRYFEASLRELDPRKRNIAMYKADNIIIEQAAVAPLYYEKWLWIVNDRVQNLNVSGLGILDLSNVYFLEEDDTIPAVSDNF